MKLEEDILENLGKLPKSLTGAYTQILDSMREGTPREWELTRKALMWIMCSRTLLTEEKWTDFVYWPKGIPENGPNILIDLCRNLVTLDTQSGVVRFVHLSVHEYLESMFDSVDTNSMAAVCCLSVLSLAYDPKPEDTNTEPSPIGLELSRYSTSHWTDHVARSHSRDKTMSGLVLDGLNRFMGTPTSPSPMYDAWLSQTGNEHLRSNPTNILFAIAYFSFGDCEQLWDDVRSHINVCNNSGETLLHMASISGNELAIKVLLENGADIDRLDSLRKSPIITAIRHEQVTVVFQLLDKGAKLHHHANALEAVAMDGQVKMLLALMDRDPSLMVTDGVLRAAVCNSNYAVDLLKHLLIRAPDIKITEAVVIAAAVQPRDADNLLKQLFIRDHYIKITEAVVVAVVEAAKFPDCTLAAIAVLVIQDPIFRFTVAILIAAINNPEMPTAQLLSQDYDFEITDSVFMAVAQNEHHSTCDDLWHPPGAPTCTGHELFLILLDKQPNFWITDATLIAVAKNYSSAHCLSSLMGSKRRVTDRSITNMISSLLRTEMWNMDSSSFQTFRILLANRKIIKGFLAAAAGNTSCGDLLMSFFLKIDPHAEITDKVMISALRHAWRSEFGKYTFNGIGEYLMSILVKAKNIDITSSVLMEEINNYSISTAAISCLLRHYKRFSLTEEVLLGLVGKSPGGVRTMGMLGGNRGTANITEAVLTELVSSRGNAEWMVRVMLSWGSEITITEAVVNSAAQNDYCGWEAIKLLLSDRQNTSITQDVQRAIVRCEKWGIEALLVIFDRDGNANIRQEIIEGAVRNPACCPAMLRLVVRRGLLRNIAEVAVTAATGSSIAGLRSIIEMQPTWVESILWPTVVADGY